MNNKHQQKPMQIDFADIWENWPYYFYNISSKSDPNQYNELGQLQDFSTEQELKL